MIGLRSASRLPLRLLVALNLHAKEHTEQPTLRPRNLPKEKGRNCGNMLDVVSIAYDPSPRRPPRADIDLVIAPRYIVAAIAEYLACEPSEASADDYEYDD
jgi:hypothetical protein